jgi:hypothetical protein
MIHVGEGRHFVMEYLVQWRVKSGRVRKAIEKYGGTNGGRDDPFILCHEAVSNAAAVGLTKKAIIKVKTSSFCHHVCI